MSHVSDARVGAFRGQDEARPDDVGRADAETTAHVGTATRARGRGRPIHGPIMGVWGATPHCNWSCSSRSVGTEAKRSQLRCALPTTTVAMRIGIAHLRIRHCTFNMCMRTRYTVYCTCAQHGKLKLSSRLTCDKDN